MKGFGVEHSISHQVLLRGNHAYDLLPFVGSKKFSYLYGKKRVIHYVAVDP